MRSNASSPLVQQAEIAGGAVRRGCGKSAVYGQQRHELLLVEERSPTRPFSNDAKRRPLSHCFIERKLHSTWLESHWSKFGMVTMPGLDVLANSFDKIAGLRMLIREAPICTMAQVGFIYVSQRGLNFEVRRHDSSFTLLNNAEISAYTVWAVHSPLRTAGTSVCRHIRN